VGTILAVPDSKRMRISCGKTVDVLERISGDCLEIREEAAVDLLFALFSRRGSF
jgi:hypothetical protein